MKEKDIREDRDQPSIPDKNTRLERVVFFYFLVRLESFVKFVKGAFENVVESGIVADIGAKIALVVRDRKAVPPNIIKGRTKVGATAGGHNRRLLNVHFKARVSFKNGENFFYGGEFVDNIVAAKSTIVSIKFWGEIRDAFEHVKQNVDDKNEERGRKRTALFNPRVKMDFSRRGVAEVGVAVGVVKESFDDVDVAVGHIDRTK